MDAIEIMNDNKHVSESFDQPASSKRSNFEEMEQVKILQTEDERESMSMRRDATLHMSDALQQISIHNIQQ